MTKNKAADFLANMNIESEATPALSVATIQPKRKPRQTPQQPERVGLKHIGGYLPDDVVEKVALLRARLKLDNSELITLAINDLYTKQKAKKAFGD
jgi:hypothetical protein